MLRPAGSGPNVLSKVYNPAIWIWQVNGRSRRTKCWCSNLRAAWLERFIFEFGLKPVEHAAAVWPPRFAKYGRLCGLILTSRPTLRSNVVTTAVCVSPPVRPGRCGSRMIFRSTFNLASRILYRIFTSVRENMRTRDRKEPEKEDEYVWLYANARSYGSFGPCDCRSAFVSAASRSRVGFR